MPDDTRDIGAAPWPVTWEAHREDQLMRMASATPAQRLAWLEEMIRLAHAAGALPRTGVRLD